MSQVTRRFMRLLVFFDLPTITKADKRAYTLFRRFLLQDGYDMLQWSVYSRIVNGEDDVKKHQQRLVANLPKKGSIRCMKVSEKQYVAMEILVGTVTTQEEKVSLQQVLVF
ncbi:CRISPR-associated endonuclease Cas2 [Deefgea piscis]|uniref:CRISPR-associated endoribonuclease Cas2 n=1 Tax=Deefgea piscis TaxID=2739061 RepID=A0A6M8SVK2_9NEIS|nr:CRISPR-associated endonuclease Cas2 [Deefgea piscis]QKJ67320.1 CRISPR-associated endonuclease Cas2 [Deefgea piscis]